GADNKNRIGPIRMVQAGLLTTKQIYQLGLLLFATSLVTAIPFIEAGGPPFLILLIVSIFFGYCYTGGPLPLAYRGLGEVFVFLFFGVVATVSAIYLQIHSIPFMGFVAGAIVGFHSVVMIAINNLRDRETDKLANKRTLAVRFGESFAKTEIIFCILAPFILTLLWINQGNYLAAFLPYLSLPLALHLTKNIYMTPPSPIYNSFLAQGGLLHILFSTLMVIGARL
ncbi:MAG: 1,4-dihydroxy-2-naphthoate octaprenyltransferase, partial [Parachlamydiaceae bacterium]